jgi:beta-N-acetylhexosaminidase
MEDMVGIANALPNISDASRARLDRAMAGAGASGDESPLEELIAERDALLAVVA